MITIRHVLTLAALLLISVQMTIAARDTVAWHDVPRLTQIEDVDACAGPFLIAFADDADFDPACAAFAACMARVDSHRQCTLDFLDSRLGHCDTDDTLCTAQARLHTALIGLTVGNGYQSSTQSKEFWIDFAAQISDRETLSDAAETGEAYNWLRPLNIDYGEHPMLTYFSGVLFEMRGEVESAIDDYSAAAGLSVRDPLIYLTRAELFAASGRAPEAALDFALVAPLAGEAGLPEDIAARLGNLDEQYVIDLSEADVYARFDMLLSHGGTLGVTRNDLSLQSPVPVRLMSYEGTLLLISDVPDEDVYSIALPFYALRRGDTGSYQWTGGDYYDDHWSTIVLAPTGAENVYEGVRVDTVFKRGSNHEFYIAPPGSPDPRPQGFRCDGAPQTRLDGAQHLTPLRYFEPIELYDRPGGAVVGEITPDMQLVIAIDEGPECAGGFTWYRVTAATDDNEYAGWLRENADATRYLFDPIAYDAPSSP